MTRSYDLIVIGAGMDGVSAANKCASAGWKGRPRHDDRSDSMRSHVTPNQTCYLMGRLL